LTDLESAICDLPRWARIIKTLQDAKFGPGIAPDEHDEALRLVIDELYEKAVKLRTMYYQSLKQARGGAEAQPSKAAAERSAWGNSPLEGRSPPALLLCGFLRARTSLVKASRDSPNTQSRE